MELNKKEMVKVLQKKEVNGKIADDTVESLFLFKN
jgi:hypothetical protein